MGYNEATTRPEGLTDSQIEGAKLLLIFAAGGVLGAAGYAMINSMEFPSPGEQPGLADEPALITPATPETRGNPEAYWGEANPEEECPGGTLTEWWGAYEARRVQRYTAEEAGAAAIRCAIGPALPEGMDPNATLEPANTGTENASDARRQFSTPQSRRQDQGARVRTEKLVYQNRPIPR